MLILHTVRRFLYYCELTERRHRLLVCTDKKENKIFLIYKEIQMGSDANSYMRKGFQIYVRGNAQIFSHI
jgi:hypothetical protein